MKFIEEVRSSIYDPAYYRGIPSEPLGSSFRFFYSFAAVVALLETIFLSFTVLPAAWSFVRGIGPKALEYYPSELVVTLKNGNVATNVPEPYFVKFPEELKNFYGQQNSQKPDNLIVIDTGTPFTIDEFKNYKTAVLLVNNSLVYGNDQKLTVQSFGRFPDVKIDKSKVASFVAKFQPYLTVFAALVPLFIFIVFIVALSANLLYFIFLALLVWLIAKIKKLPVGYKKSYQLCLHLAIVPILIDYLWSLVSGPHIPFLFTIAFVIVALVNLRSAPNDTSTGVLTG